MKTQYLIICLLFIAVFDTVAQDRPVYWLHGLNANLWRQYAPLYQGLRTMTSITPSYQNGNGIVNAAQNLTIASNANNYLIGHSLGGLAAREFERTHPNSVSAILTIGTPHRGAFVAANVLNGNARTTILRGADDVTAGPISEGKTNVITILGSLTGLPQYIVSRLANKSIDRFVQDNLYVKIEQQINDVLNGSVNSLRDMQPNSAYLNGLNSRAATVLTANIVCEENDRPGLRLAAAAIFPPENADFEAFDDTGLILAADKLKSAYRVFRVYHDVQKFAIFWRARYHNRMANRWQRGEDYFGSKFDAEYAQLIGAARTEQVTMTNWVEVCESSCIDEQLSRKFLCEELSNRQNCRWEQRTTTVTKVINEKSDGLVTDATQQIPGVPPDRIYRALGTNHLEVGNHREMTISFTRVFNRPDQLGIPARN